MNLAEYLYNLYTAASEDADKYEDLWDGESVDNLYIQMCRAKAQRSQILEIIEDLKEGGVI